jgi:hypothetical protein
VLVALEPDVEIFDRVEVGSARDVRDPAASKEPRHRPSKVAGGFDCGQIRLRELIKESKRFPLGFKLLNYQVHARFVKFEVLDKDQAVYERVLAAINRYKLRIAKQKNGFEQR